MGPGLEEPGRETGWRLSSFVMHESSINKCHSALGLGPRLLLSDEGTVTSLAQIDGR